MSMCSYIFDGVDTDGTVFYACTTHGASMPSTAAHCDQATDSPAYVANTNPFNLMRDFEPDDDYSRMTHERETDHGVFRAVVERDDYPDAPDNDYGYPVVRVDTGRTWRNDFEMTGYGTESARHDGLADDLASIIQRVYDGGPGGYGSDNAGCGNLDDALEVVNRWLKAFHGGSLVTSASAIHQDSTIYVAYDTRAMREHWGQTGQMLETSDPDGDEWQAYIDGEVYVVSVERASFDEDGDIVDWEDVGHAVGGHYGDDWAAQAAMEMLEDEIDHAASQMLPLA